MKTLAIDFIRQAIEQTLELEHLKNEKYFGGKNQVNLMSFYEQLTEQYEIDRFTEVYRDLVDQQNRSGLIMNGTIVAPETPQIMNINSSLVVPMAFNVSFRVALKDRDSAIETLDNLVKIMRARKRDIACFEDGKLFMVGTVADNVLGAPKCKTGDFIGEIATLEPIGDVIETRINEIKALIGDELIVDGDYFYVENSNKLYKAINNVGNDVEVVGSQTIGEESNITRCDITETGQDDYHFSVDIEVGDNEDLKQEVGKAILESELHELLLDYGEEQGSDFTSLVENLELELDEEELHISFDIRVQEDLTSAEISNLAFNVLFAKNKRNTKWYIDETFEHQSKTFSKYKVSLSFDSTKIDEPKTLNANEYCTIAFGGSATLVDKDSSLGNDLTKVGIAKYKIQAKTDITLDGVNHWLEPLEMPSGLGISGEISQLASHNFNQNRHNDGIKPTFDYSFVLNKSEPLLNQLFKYARYGITGTPTLSYADGVSPNTLYRITELWNSWCEIEKYVFLAKATENIDVENTESDALTIKITFEKQKE